MCSDQQRTDDRRVHGRADAERPEVAVILAAGEGSRMAAYEPGTPKPLIKLLGLPLIERTMLACREAGIREFIVVTGYEHERLQAGLEQIAARRGFNLHCVFCPEWSKGNGASALAAAEAVAGRDCILMMADHLVESGLIERVCTADWHDADVMLAVDTDLDAVHDPDEVTRVAVDGDRIRHIGKTIEEWNAADTGVFRCRGPLFDALREVQAAGRFGLSDAVQLLAGRGRAQAVDVTGCQWLDVDTPAAYREAKRRLMASLTKGTQDGFVSAYLNRPVSLRLSALIANTPVTPNQITIVCFLLMLLAAGLLASPWYWAWVLGGLLVQFSSIADGCDGEIARLKHIGSRRGAWLDTMLDRYGDLAVTLAIVWRAAQRYVCPYVWPAGLVAAAGFILASYVTKEFALRMGWSYPDDVLNRLKRRDLRLLALAAGAVLGFPYVAVLLAGALSHMCIAGILARGWMLARGC